MRVYADGSALVRYLPFPEHSVDWQRWAERHGPDLLVTSLSLSELRHAAATAPAHVRARAHAAVDRLEVARFSDQAVAAAAMSTAVLSPFASLHLGVALAHPGVTAFASYDVRLASVAALHGLEVVSPGLPDRWWDAAA
ncbi:PIN domain-containing protein [Cellulomonas pakistanensis]|uniref:PIN domain-containing protein n=1 Tax=Cellulomonas pakistanensis TaxID=992287 RepID=UPI001EF35E2D|nr:PIN domain-containing protein [Cellulomonas pakistanensis]